MCFAFSITIIALINHNYIDKKRTKVENIVQQVPSQNKVEPQINVKPQPPVIEKEPGDNVQWMNFPKQKSVNNSNYGPVLTDIVEHLPSKYGSEYDDRSLTTTGHETLHGICSELRNYKASGRNMNGFYCLNDKAAFIANPQITIGDVAKRVPQSLRGSRYQLYLVTARKDWDDTPTYLIDEWVAYVGGVEVGVDQVKSGKTRDSSESRSDLIIGPIEFSYYVLAMGKAIEEQDGNYIGKEQFKEFVAYNIKRTAKAYQESKNIQSLQWETNIIDAFATSELKDFAVKWYGQKFVDQYLLLKK